MTKEEKQLLIIDLCMRLPYYTELYSNVADGNWAILTPVVISNLMNATDKLMIKPYLRPMSSMTEEEKKEYESIFSIGEYSNGGSLYGEEYEYINDSYNDVTQSVFLIDWLNAHHFDYRGLIEKSLAIVAPGDMYKNK